MYEYQITHTGSLKKNFLILQWNAYEWIYSWIPLECTHECLLVYSYVLQEIHNELLNTKKKNMPNHHFTWVYSQMYMSVFMRVWASNDTYRFIQKYNLLLQWNACEWMYSWIPFECTHECQCIHKLSMQEINKELLNINNRICLIWIHLTWVY